MVNVLQLVVLGLRFHARLAAENLFLRKQLAPYLEREVKPRRVTKATRVTLVVLAQFTKWRAVLTIVQPDTLLRWHRHAASAVLALDVSASRTPADSTGHAATDRRHGEGEPDLGRGAHRRGTAGQARDRLSPRTIRRYMRRPPLCHRGPRSQGWSTFVRNHAREVLACDFFLTITAAFRMVYVFVVLDIGTRRIVHWNITTHPTGEWTVQQFRTCITGKEPHSIHDPRPRPHLLESGGPGMTAMGLRILKTPLPRLRQNRATSQMAGFSPSLVPPYLGPPSPLGRSNPARASGDMVRFSCQEAVRGGRASSEAEAGPRTRRRPPAREFVATPVAARIPLSDHGKRLGVSEEESAHQPAARAKGGGVAMLTGIAGGSAARYRRARSITSATVQTAAADGAAHATAAASESPPACRPPSPDRIPRAPIPAARYLWFRNPAILVVCEHGVAADLAPSSRADISGAARPPLREARARQNTCTRSGDGAGRMTVLGDHAARDVARTPAHRARPSTNTWRIAPMASRVLVLRPGVTALTLT